MLIAVNVYTSLYFTYVIEAYDTHA